MNNKNLTNRSRVERGLIAAVLALLFAGSATAVAASALGVVVPVASLYAAAFAAVALCVAGTLTGGTVIASLGFLAVAGLYLATHGAGLAGLRELFTQWSGQAAESAGAAEGTGALACFLPQAARDKHATMSIVIATNFLTFIL